jgi:hypothetical protein
MLGRVNFLFDRSQTPHVSARELCSHFGVGQSIASEKVKRIQESLKIDVFDPCWTLASRLADNPRVWQIMINLETAVETSYGAAAASSGGG